jgi:L,D-peptidoglycan transpeptidase YkuD (ErfK/YbiS/YcfS/YnhG family)
VAEQSRTDAPRRAHPLGRPLLAIVLATGLAAGLATAPATPVAAASCNQSMPTKLHHLGSSTQVVIATANGWHSTWGKVRVFEKQASGSGTRWCLMLGPYTARFGYHGLVQGTKRIMNSGTTPAGTYSLPKAFGLRSDPGTALPYTHSDVNDYWALDRKYPWTFNTYRFHGVHGFRASEAEHIAHFSTQYRYAAVIGFNLPSAGHRANRTRGGAIFLHVNGTGATAGCVSVSQTAMVAILRRLTPSKHPKIVIAPTSWLGQA